MLFVLAVVALISLSVNGAFVKPWYCHDLDCPIFSNPQNLSIEGQTVEIKIYESALYVSNMVNNSELNDAIYNGFWKDYDYMLGRNKDYQVINMTCPVLNYIQPLINSSNYFMVNDLVSIYIPYNMQPPNPPPPKPLENDVKLITFPKLTIASLGFDGYDDQSLIIAKYNELYQLLSKSGYSYNKNEYYYAGYDPKERTTGRFNEIWIEIYGYNHTKI